MASRRQCSNDVCQSNILVVERLPAFENSKRERCVEGVACSSGIHRVDRNRRDVPDFRITIPIPATACAVCNDQYSLLWLALADLLGREAQYLEFIGSEFEHRRPLDDR